MERNDYNTQNELANDEVLSGDEGKLRQMLGGLKRIDAPQNFDFALRRKIAEHQPETAGKINFLPFLRFALPFCLLVLFAGFVGFDLFLSPHIADVPAVAENIPPRPISPTIAENSPISPISPSVSQVQTVKEISAAPVAPKIPKTINKVLPTTRKDENQNLTKDEDFVGTRDSAITSSRPILPKGLNQNQKPLTTENVLNNNPIPAQQILSQIGIEADYAETNWRVKTVKEKSLAERSGVKNGDLIEAIDDRKLDFDTVFTQTYSGKTIHIIRDGKKITLDLGTSQPK